MASQEIVPAEEVSPLAKFDSGTLKGMASREVDDGAPRAMFLPTTMGEAMELAKLMAAGNFVAAHLRGKPGDCLAVVMQATRWSMDPFAVANKTYFVNDRIAYEAQLVNAVINSAHVLDGRLHPTWEGEGNDLVCTVTGKLKGDPEVKSRRVPIKNITTRNSPLWKQDPEQQLAYYAQRAWVRLHAPEVLLGVYTPDELEEVERRERREAVRSEAAPLSASMLVDQSKPAASSDVVKETSREIDGPVDDEPMQDEDTDDETGETPSEKYLRELREEVSNALTIAALKIVDAKWVNARAAYDDDTARDIDDLITDRRRALSAPKEG